MKVPLHRHFSQLLLWMRTGACRGQELWRVCLWTWWKGRCITQNPVQETSEGVVQQVKEEYYPSDELLEKFARENQDAADQSSDSAETPSSSETSRDVIVQADGDTSSAAQGADQDLIPAVATPANGILYPTQSLYDYTFLINYFYITDSSTASDASLINGETLLNRDLTLDLTGEEPVILIYHTHSQEKFADSRDGEIYDTVVGLGNTLTSILQEKISHFSLSRHRHLRHDRWR